MRASVRRRTPAAAPTAAPERRAVDEVGLAVDEATAWLSGEGDLLIAAAGRSVPVAVQLGVLAHGSFERLTNLGKDAKRGVVRRAWGIEMASLAGDIASATGSGAQLAAFQTDCLIPLEIEVLAGHRAGHSRVAIIQLVTDRLPA
jgi:hypothetical protein